MTPEDNEGMVRITVRFPDGMTLTFDIEPDDTETLGDVVQTIRLMLPSHTHRSSEVPS